VLHASSSVGRQVILGAVLHLHQTFCCYAENSKKGGSVVIVLAPLWENRAMSSETLWIMCPYSLIKWLYTEDCYGYALVWNTKKTFHNFHCKAVSLHMSQITHQARAYPGFRSMNWLGVNFYSPMDGCLSIAGIPAAFNLPLPIYRWTARVKVSCPTQHSVPGQDSNPACLRPAH